MYGWLSPRSSTGSTLAKNVAENDAQKAYITKLIDYYITGDLRLFDEYSILWQRIQNRTSTLLTVFIESYGDPLGMTGHGSLM